MSLLCTAPHDGATRPRRLTGGVDPVHTRLVQRTMVGLFADLQRCLAKLQGEVTG